MPAYVVSMMSVHDADTCRQYTCRQYTDRTPPIVKKHGGEFRTRGEAFTCIDGNDCDGRLVILEFPSKADVEAWFADPDYQEAMKFRHASSVMNYLLLQEGGANTEDPDPKLWLVMSQLINAQYAMSTPIVLTLVKMWRWRWTSEGGW